MVAGKRELCGVARDDKGIHPWLLRKHESKAHAIVIRPGDHAKGAIAFLQRQVQFIVMIPHVAVFAEVVLPIIVRRSPLFALHGGFFPQLHIAGQFQPQAGPQQ